MKQFILYSILTGFSIAVCAQNGLRPIKDTSTAVTSDLWNLNRYVWSQTHPTASKGDKPRLDFDAIDNWIGVGLNVSLSISRDGQYFAYTVDLNNTIATRGIRNHKKDDSLVVQSTTNAWKKSFAGASPGFFSGNSKAYIFKDKHDLYFLPLGGKQTLCVKEVASYKLPGNGKNEWLAYQLTNSASALALRNLLTGKEKRFDAVGDYNFDPSGEWLALQLTNELKELVIYNLATAMERHFESVAGYTFDATGKVLILKAVEKKTGEAITSLQYVSLAEGTSKVIWSTADSGVRLSNYSLDGSGRQVVFTVQSFDSAQDSHAENSIWYYKAGMEKAVKKIDNRTRGVDAGLVVQASASFAGNDHYIQFSLQARPDTRVPWPEAVGVDVWNYKDSILQFDQSLLLKEPARYSAVINPESGRLIRLETAYEKLHLLTGDFAIIEKTGAAIHGDRFWEKDYEKGSNWLMSLKDGSRHLLPTMAGRNNYSFCFSPGGKYLVYFDLERQSNYFSYELSTGRMVKISSAVHADILGYQDPLLRPLQPPISPIGVAGWLAEDEGLLVYDAYDIWQLDLAGKKAPLNITNGYGRSHQILFTLMGSERYRPTNQLVLSAQKTLLIRAFNKETKYNGFYRKTLSTAGNPELLYMGPCFFDTVVGQEGLDDGMHPLKAADANKWIVKRQTPTEAPNYFVTSDFKTYTSLTNLQPHKGYNWITAKLISFKQLDGTMSQGVLYKPENFDPAKKYPLIISFYGSLSDGLYQYPTPLYQTAPDLFESPSWMVSHGYLVFLPDIYFTKNKWGPSTVNTVDGAARYLRELPYVDGKHMGAVGHSNSGRFGYYLLTHSHSFAAMSIGSGFTGTDIISLALGQRAGTNSLEIAEKGAFGTALGNLWENKQSWIDHTAVLQADKATSPLLLFHNKKEGDDVRAAIELFISFRRLEKPVWWLQYDKGDHRLRQLNEQRDFTIRYTQFFDHYLKGAPAPRWMTQGIPAAVKGIESRYELDPNGWCGKDCPVCRSLHGIKPAANKISTTAKTKKKQI